MHVWIFQLILRSFWLELFGRHPHVGWQSSSKVLHIQVATHRDHASVRGRTLPWMHLERQDSASHSILSLSYDRQTGSQRLTFSSTPDLLVILCCEANDVVEIVATNVGHSCRMVLVARRTAEVHCAANDELSSIVAHLPNEIFWRDCFT